VGIGDWGAHLEMDASFVSGRRSLVPGPSICALAPSRQSVNGMEWSRWIQRSLLVNKNCFLPHNLWPTCSCHPSIEMDNWIVKSTLHTGKNGVDYKLIEARLVIKGSGVRHRHTYLVDEFNDVVRKKEVGCFVAVHKMTFWGLLICRY